MTEPALLAFRAAAPVRDVPALLARLAAAKGALPVQLLRADRVYGADHLRLAALLAGRAVHERRARAADLPTETLLYAAGERQVGKALAFMGLHAGVEAVAALAWGDEAAEALARFAAAEGWTRDDALLDGGEHVLAAFEVPEVEKRLYPPARWPDLILERVALVDVLKA